MNDPKTIRKQVREVLALAPRIKGGERRRFTERMIFDGVQKFCTDPLTVDELKAALEWNLSRNLIESRWDDEEEQNTWALTPAGENREAGK
jgi:hypothetical protein